MPEQSSESWTGQLPAARDSAEAIARGDALSAELVAACLNAIDQRESTIGAWQFLDADRARNLARELDDLRRSGAPMGPLAGVPVGVKDNIDTADMPTEDGTPLHAGRVPADDAFLVTRLREAGALPIGKTVTTEFAYFSPGRTGNPHNPAHTPGGSSSGSAAAVAAGMVPLAIGTQTNGSVIRPAAFCGVVGFKPSRGLISRRGVLQTSPTLDQVGVFARSVGDAALLAQALIAHDPADSASRPWAAGSLVDLATAEPPLPPAFGWLHSPLWEQASADTRAGFEELAEVLGDRCERFELGEAALAINRAHATVMQAEMAWSLQAEYQRGRARMSDRLIALIETGMAVSALDYQRACHEAEGHARDIDDLFSSCDVLMLPAAPGSAPAGLSSTGDPVFCSLGSLLGLPAISLPLLVDDAGMPMGVQLLGRHRQDARLLRAANWLVSTLAAT
jgi:Asp-tRNA(Asn)/Glu-tRNA(Gln) amidotransferase A subunit family amidase